MIYTFQVGPELLSVGIGEKKEIYVKHRQTGYKFQRITLEKLRKQPEWIGASVKVKSRVSVLEGEELDEYIKEEIAKDLGGPHHLHLNF